ncbi:PEP-CTERM sorting domain-containing protein [Duganella sp. FT80W]|uniref:PEP-CTERM sorting domain-containing protein n=1 Tax=Duganella guangzhouensis TaxID=2666084 RepID=A0A6I2KXL2_9BURK|nr:PEP-CTERM sorting domain-containing protein [Duganella guangzhouensis]MRW90541.1 PEP-CTERM sorting domain-containing protein [Duganella guangzhouensis]
MKKLLRIGRMMLVAFSFLSCYSAQAALYTMADATSVKDYKDWQDGAATLHSKATSAGINSITVQESIASYGVLKTYSSAQSGELYGIGGWASAGWSDRITMNNEALTGKHGVLVLNFSYTDQVAAYSEPNGKYVSGFYNNQVDVLSSNKSYHAEIQHTISSANGNSNFPFRGSVSDFAGQRTLQPNLISMVIDFVWGESFLLAQTASTDCNVGYTLSEPFASCAADSFHSSYWAGISDVSTDGLAVSSFTISAASGTDYSRSFVPLPVPEPGSLYLMLAGMAFTVLRLTLKRARHTSQFYFIRLGS